MVTCPNPANPEPSLFKYERGAEVCRVELPKEALLLSILKPLETRLQDRGLVCRTAQSNLSPLWFSGVTERNTFLWRHGYSLSAESRFSFWVDPEALIAKRMRHLELLQKGDVQYLDSNWGLVGIDSDSARRELDYLNSLRVILTKIQKQACILSQLQVIIESELVEKQPSRQVILLPYRGGNPPSTCGKPSNQPRKL